VVVGDKAVNVPPEHENDTVAPCNAEPNSWVTVRTISPLEAYALLGARTSVNANARAQTDPAAKYLVFMIKKKELLIALIKRINYTPPTASKIGHVDNLFLT